MFRREDPINLRFFTERAQGHFLSPWSRSAERFAQNNHDCLFLRISAVRESLLRRFEEIVNFFFSFLLLSG
jgi:hypothetical protein